MLLTPGLAYLFLLAIGAPMTSVGTSLDALPEPEPTLIPATHWIEPEPLFGPVAPRLTAIGDRRVDGLYLQLGAGLATTSDSSGPGEEIDFDEGYAVPLAFGNRYAASDSDPFAFDLELEGYWSDQDTDEPNGPINAVRDVTVLGALLNGVLDVALGDSVSLYGGAGIGLSYLDVGTQSDAVNDFDDEDGPFLTWQVKAGLRWYANQSVSWNVGYRFVNIDDVEIDDDVGMAGFDLETEQHVLELGLRFTL